MMLLLYYITYCLITNIITQAYSPDANESTLYDYQHIIDDPALGMHEYVSHFKSFHFEWNNANEWTWSSSHNHSMNINESIACSKQNPSLCIHTQFTTNTATKQIESFKSLTIHYKDTPLTPNKIALDFWNDLDWSQVNIIHHHDTNDAIDRRHLLQGALTAKYDNIYYMHDEDMSNANGYNDDDALEDVYNMDDFNQYLDEFPNPMAMLRNAHWGRFQGILKGAKRPFGKYYRVVHTKIGVNKKPPCHSTSRCRVYLYDAKNFKVKINKKGHFCEGEWDRWRLLKYKVRRKLVSSVKVQGSPCCVMIAYNGKRFDGDKQAMFPRGRYPSMRTGLDTSYGMGNGMNGMGGGGFMGMMGGGVGMYRANSAEHGFPNNALSSMKIVHNCRLRQTLMRRALGREGMNGLESQTNQMYLMQMLLRMMFPHKHRHHRHGPTYAQIAKAQQKQLQQMMHSMMTSSMANQAPIAIPNRRRVMAQGKMNNMHVVGVRKCKLLDYTEICVTFDAVNSKIGVGYTVKDRREIKTSDGVTPWERMESLVELFEDVDAIWNENEDEMDMNMDDHIQGEEEEEETFDDIEQWVDPATNSDPLEWFANRYYDHGIMPQHTETKDTHNQNMDSFDLKLDAKKLEALETKHRMQLFMGPVNYAMVRNELIFFDDFGYDLKYLDLRLPTDHDMIDYFDTFVLESQNANDWMAMTNTSDKCNDVVLSHISYWICVNEKGLIYFERHQGTNDTLYDESLQLFYERTRGMINEELDQTKLNMMNDRDWSEVYAIQQQGEERKKLCDYVSMMKLCVEGESNHFNITIHYLSDEVSKQMIRQANEILNEWVVWSDLL
eukprot:999054_1